MQIWSLSTFHLRTVEFLMGRTVARGWRVEDVGSKSEASPHITRGEAGTALGFPSDSCSAPQYHDT